MKKLVNIHFDWQEGFHVTSGPTYLMTTRVGSVKTEFQVHVFPDERGFYDGNIVPLVFDKTLEKAKKRAESRILAELKS